MRTFPKSRLETLTDAVFAFAMTLLVLEIRLPAGLAIHDGAALIAHLRTLGSELIAYAISFFVLAAQWRGDIALRRDEAITPAVLGWSFVYLFFITAVPFSSSVVGHYGDLPPAIWLYAANMVIIAALSMWLRVVGVVGEHVHRVGETRLRTGIFMVSALVSVALSVVAPRQAMYAYGLTLLAGPLTSLWGRRHGGGRPQAGH
jgi:uncharacterized membrane protein